MLQWWTLLVISFDRYFSITRPLTYRAKRTTKRGHDHDCIWPGPFLFILWAPAILFWQYFVGERTVPRDQCYIQFLSEPITHFLHSDRCFLSTCDHHNHPLLEESTRRRERTAPRSRWTQGVRGARGVRRKPVQKWYELSTLAMFPSTIFMRNFGISHKKRCA